MVGDWNTAPALGAGAVPGGVSGVGASASGIGAIIMTPGMVGDSNTAPVFDAGAGVGVGGCEAFGLEDCWVCAAKGVIPLAARSTKAGNTLLAAVI